MQVTVEPRENFTILHLRGEFDTFYCALLQKEIDGLIELDPDADGPLPTFVGTYREKVNGVVYGEDGERVVQFRLRTVARADDGSTLKLALSGKVTVNAKGRVASQREVASCVIS